MATNIIHSSLKKVYTLISGEYSKYKKAMIQTRDDMYQPYPVEGPKNILVLTRKQSNFLLELSVLKGAA